ncbi:hypothetical protein CRV09_02880 [Candidatus Pantoea edessiphila]|uniref:CinA C-terminal domain-containing protein n=1 Tax=Candidatus Pantoea edessiphila TaxID=2044610 RepID=A0A2P5T1K9_9GAMM|nr:nicotinamide-nucleotide amidohydrolase family protein [Candidatus Pantoea edessiphila]PPI88484.1 hypothetical protein CRV09_02880 [Candidatus Pantoea edessiphila]
MFGSKLQLISQHIGNQLRFRKATISCAESCTGGWISKIFTDTIGSSNWFECGFITYSNKSKQKLLGINSTLLVKFGAVSKIIACEMALRAKSISGTDYSIAVTGIAGPSGGRIDNPPVGTIWFSFAGPKDKIFTVCHQFKGCRDIIRYQSVFWALQIFYKEFLMS